MMTKHNTQYIFKRCTIILVLVMCLFAPVVAQNYIKGKVIGEDGSPLVGATIVSKQNGKIGTSTDANGNFRLKLPNTAKETLHISYIGFIPQEISVVPNSKGKEMIIRLKEDAIGTQTIVVTGTRTPKLLKDVPVVTMVITDKEIQRMDATTIADVLETALPGIEFSFKMNQQPSLNMQGFGGTSILFLIDGERMAGETMDNIDFNRINMNNVARIEIVKGAAASLYGSNAVGGVVNIITKTAQNGYHINLAAHYAEPSSQRYNASIGIGGKKLSSNTDFQHTYDKAITLVDEDVKSDIRAVNGFRTYNISEKLVYNPTKNLKFTGKAGYYFKERGTEIKELDKGKERYRDFMGLLKGEYSIKDNQSLELSYQFDQYDKSYYHNRWKTDTLNYRNVQNSLRGLYNYTLADKHTFTLGGDIVKDYLKSYQFSKNGSHEQYNMDVFAQADLNFNKHWNVMAGLRYDYYSAAQKKNLSTKLALMYKYSNCSFRLSYADGFRAPTLKEMYMNFNMANIFMIYGNEDLKPEKSKNFIASAEYMKGRINVSLIGSYNIIDNKITTIWNQDLNGMEYINTRGTKILGLSANATFKCPFGLTAQAGYAYTKEVVKVNEPQTADTRPHSFNLQLVYDKKWDKADFSLTLKGRAMSSLKQDQFASSSSTKLTKIDVPGYMIWDLLYTLNLPKGIRMNYSINNLFNYKPKYYYNNSPITIGTTFSVSLAWNMDCLSGL